MDIVHRREGSENRILFWILCHAQQRTLRTVHMYSTYHISYVCTLVPIPSMRRMPKSMTGRQLIEFTWQQQSRLEMRRTKTLDHVASCMLDEWAGSFFGTVSTVLPVLGCS